MCLRPASRGAGDVSVREPAQQQTLSLGRRASPPRTWPRGSRCGRFRRTGNCNDYRRTPLRGDDEKRLESGRAASHRWWRLKGRPDCSAAIAGPSQSQCGLGQDTGRFSQRTILPSLVAWMILTGKRRNRQLVRRFVQHQFKAADVTAVHTIRLRHHTVVPHRRFARGTLPRHGRRILLQNEISKQGHATASIAARYALGQLEETVDASQPCSQVGQQYEVRPYRVIVSTA